MIISMAVCTAVVKDAFVTIRTAYSIEEQTHRILLPFLAWPYGWERTACCLAALPVPLPRCCFWLVDGSCPCAGLSNGSSNTPLPAKQERSCHGSRFSHVWVPAVLISLQDFQSYWSHVMLSMLRCSFSTAFIWVAIGGTKSALLFAITAMYNGPLYDICHSLVLLLLELLEGTQDSISHSFQVELLLQGLHCFIGGEEFSSVSTNSRCQIC